MNCVNDDARDPAFPDRDAAGAVPVHAIVGDDDAPQETVHLIVPETDPRRFVRRRDIVANDRRISPDDNPRGLARSEIVTFRSTRLTLAVLSEP